jgi:hypothetical protein
MYDWGNSTCAFWGQVSNLQNQKKGGGGTAPAPFGVEFRTYKTKNEMRLRTQPLKSHYNFSHSYIKNRDFSHSIIKISEIFMIECEKSRFLM